MTKKSCGFFCFKKFVVNINIKEHFIYSSSLLYSNGGIMKRKPLIEIISSITLLGLLANPLFGYNPHQQQEQKKPKKIIEQAESMDEITQAYEKVEVFSHVLIKEALHAIKEYYPDYTYKAKEEYQKNISPELKQIYNDLDQKVEEIIDLYGTELDSRMRGEIEKINQMVSAPQKFMLINKELYSVNKTLKSYETDNSILIEQEKQDLEKRKLELEKEKANIQNVKREIRIGDYFKEAQAKVKAEISKVLEQYKK